MSLPISLATVFTFCTLNIGFALIPGPDVICIVTNSMARGRSAGAWVCLGIATALLFHAGCAIAGLSAILLGLPKAYLVVKIAGACYLVWLSVRMIRHPAVIDITPSTSVLDHPFVQGAVTNLLNPKIALFAVAILPQFIDVSRGAVVMQTATLCLLWIVSGTATNLLTAVIAAQMRRVLLARPRVFKRMQQMAGIILFGLAARIAFDRVR